jgi:glycosyltransferase involved in cell wall biosynthesis
VAKVSIITVVKDHALGLRDTYLSLTSQDFSEWEMLIVVGTSRDSTLQAAKEISDKDSRVKVIEQSGFGIYGAMNEGIRDADSEYSWFMNGGDRFADTQVLGVAMGEIMRAGVGVLVGGYRIDGGTEKQVYVYPRKVLTTSYFAFNRHGGCHQAMVFRTDLLRKVGGFNPGYSLASDFDLVLKVIEQGGAVRIPEIFASIEPGGAADQGIFLVHQQKHQIRKSFFGKGGITFLSLAWTTAARTKVKFRRFLQDRSPP